MTWQLHSSAGKPWKQAVSVDGASILGLCLLFFGVAVVYSAAGFGGGSSYLAILSFAMNEFQTVRSLALLCNLVVVCGSTSLFWHRGFLLPGRVIPLVAASVPAAFVAAQLRFDPSTFFVILGITLIAASAAMFWQRRGTDPPARPHWTWVDASLGGVVGFLAGLVGIGGGIFLSPLLHLLNWDTAKRIAAVAAFFILVNSLAGLAGLVVSQQFQVSDGRLLWLLLAVFLGGQLGVRFCLNSVAVKRIRYLTALIVMMAGVRILWAQFV